MKYRYYINDTEVFPKGEWSIEYQRNDGQIFFRRIFEGELTFGDADYDLITGLSCEIAEFDIYCGGTVFWQGQFQYPYKIKFDDDSCVVVLTPEVVDEYSCIMGNYETEYKTYPGIGGINPQLWSCPAPGGNIHTFTFIAYKLIDNTGVADNWIDHILNINMLCNLDVESSFFNMSNFANGDNYAGVYGNNNYITGATNRLDFIYLLPNSRLRNDFGGTFCDSPMPFTFKMFEDVLRNAFNAYWFIDENGDFRVEHIYYFDPAFAHSDYIVGIDLETVMGRGGRSFTYRRNKYEYETGRMHDQERWTWQHFEETEGTIAHGQDFEGVPIFYGAAVNQKSDYVPGDFKEKELASPKFWSDIVWGQALVGAGTADTISCPTGFCMIDVVDDAPGNKINCEVGVLSAASVANGHLSTANLQDHYHQYDRIFLQGNMNTGDVLLFETAQKHKLQEAIEFPLCCDESFDPLNRIRTGLGDGEVKAAVQKKQSLEVELWHEFDCAELCIEYQERMCFDGNNNYVLLSATPSFEGTKIIEFCCHIPSGEDYSGSNQDNLIGFQGAAGADRFFVYMLDIGGTSYMNICVNNVVMNNGYFNFAPYFDAPIHVEVSKGAASINYIKVNGVNISYTGGAGVNYPNSAHFGWKLGGLAGQYYYGTLWDVKIRGLHWWKGYPAGNTNAAWVDQIGAINGTVNGAPALWPC